MRRARAHRGSARGFGRSSRNRLHCGPGDQVLRLVPRGVQRQLQRTRLHRGTTTCSAAGRRCGRASPGWRTRLEQVAVGSWEVGHGPVSRPRWTSSSIHSALCAFLAAWYSASAAGESTSPSVGWGGTSRRRGDARNASRARRPSELTFICPKPGSAAEVGPQLVRVRWRPPHPRRVAVVALLDVTARSWTRSAIVPGSDGSPVSRGTRSRSVRGERRGVKGADPLACSASGPEKAFFDGHLLVEREADQERHRVPGDQLVGLVGLGEVQAIGHRPILARLTRRGYAEGCAEARGRGPGTERTRAPTSSPSRKGTRLRTGSTARAGRVRRSPVCSCFATRDRPSRRLVRFGHSEYHPVKSAPGNGTTRWPSVHWTKLVSAKPTNGAVRSFSRSTARYAPARGRDIELSLAGTRPPSRQHWEAEADRPRRATGTGKTSVLEVPMTPSSSKGGSTSDARRRPAGRLPWRRTRDGRDTHRGSGARPLAREGRADFPRPRARRTVPGLEGIDLLIETEGTSCRGGRGAIRAEMRRRGLSSAATRPGTALVSVLHFPARCCRGGEPDGPVHGAVLGPGVRPSPERRLFYDPLAPAFLSGGLEAGCGRCPGSGTARPDPRSSTAVPRSPHLGVVLNAPGIDRQLQEALGAGPSSS